MARRCGSASRDTPVHKRRRKALVPRRSAWSPKSLRAFRSGLLLEPISTFVVDDAPRLTIRTGEHSRFHAAFRAYTGECLRSAEPLPFAFGLALDLAVD